MRANTKRVLAAGALVLAACGGSWSNRDIEFATALPDRADLRSKLPSSSSNTNPLTGISTRRDGLDVGDPSGAFASALTATTTFNGILDFLLTVLDTVRQLPPTSRTATARTWGPYNDDKNQGYTFTVTVQEGASTDGGLANFGWALRAQQLGSEPFDVVQGVFTPSASVKKGRGAMVVTVSDFRDRLVVDNTFKSLDRIGIEYDTASEPSDVKMAFVFRSDVDAGVSAIGYHYQENTDRSGAMSYRVKSSSPELTVYDVAAGWLASGEGGAQTSVVAGTYAGAKVTECWSSAFKVVYYAESWTGGHVSGVSSSCFTLPSDLHP